MGEEGEPAAQAPRIAEGTTALVRSNSPQTEPYGLKKDFRYKAEYHRGQWLWRLVGGGGMAVPDDVAAWLTRVIASGLDSSSFMGLELLSYSEPAVNLAGEGQQGEVLRDLLAGHQKDVDEGRIAPFDAEMQDVPPFMRRAKRHAVPGPEIISKAVRRFDKLAAARQSIGRGLRRIYEGIDEADEEHIEGDEEWKARVEQITDPMDMLKEMVKGVDAGFFGAPDPYYRDLRTCLLKQAEKVIKG